VAGAVARDAADAGLFREVAVPAIQNLVREHRDHEDPGREAGPRSEA
jgi:hypothetical protein